MADQEPDATKQPSPAASKERTREAGPQGQQNRAKQIASAVMVMAVWAGVAGSTWAFTRITDGKYMVAFIAAFAFGGGTVSTYFVTRRL